MAWWERRTCLSAARQQFGWHAPHFRLAPPLSFGHFPRERGKPETALRGEPPAFPRERWKPELFGEFVDVAGPSLPYCVF